MHWARVIRETDNPEWTAVLHADGGVSEVKVSVDHDTVHIHVTEADGKSVFITRGSGGVTSWLSNPKDQAPRMVDRE